MSWVLITGAGQGLGAEISQHLASRGYDILIHYRKSAEQALQVRASCRSFGVKAEMIQGDFSNELSTRAFIRELLKLYPEIKYLVNNVGNYLVKHVSDTTDVEYRALFQTNLFAAVELTQALLPTIQQQEGNIVNIGVTGLHALRSDIYSPFYTMTKECLLIFTKSLAKEFASKSVRVNMVSPGYLENSVDLPNSDTLPMERPGYFHEVARVVDFLIDKESAYITGQNIEVAGAVRL